MTSVLSTFKSLSLRTAPRNVRGPVRQVQSRCVIVWPSESFRRLASLRLRINSGNSTGPEPFHMEVARCQALPRGFTVCVLCRC